MRLAGLLLAILVCFSPVALGQTANKVTRVAWKGVPVDSDGEFEFRVGGKVSYFSFTRKDGAAVLDKETNIVYYVGRDGKWRIQTGDTRNSKNDISIGSGPKNLATRIKQARLTYTRNQLRETKTFKESFFGPTYTFKGENTISGDGKTYTYNPSASEWSWTDSAGKKTVLEKNSELNQAFKKKKAERLALRNGYNQATKSALKISPEAAGFVYVKDEAPNIRYRYNEYTNKWEEVNTRNNKVNNVQDKKIIEQLDKVRGKEIKIKKQQQLQYEQEIYSTTYDILNAVLGPWAYEFITEKCKEDFEASEPENGQPVSDINTGPKPPGISGPAPPPPQDGGPTLPASCEGAQVVTAQVTGHKSGDTKKTYTLSYTIRNCDPNVQSLAYEIALKNHQIARVITGTVTLGQTKQEQTSHVLEQNFEQVCIFTPNTPDFAEDGQFCMPLVQAGGQEASGYRGTPVSDEPFDKTIPGRRIR